MLSSGDAQKNLSRSVQFRFEGELHLLQTSSTASGILFSANIITSVYQVTGASESAFTDTTGISRSFTVQISKGKFKRLWFHNGASPAALASIKMLLSYLQCQLPPGTEHYEEAEEDDLNGHCRIRYTRFYSDNGTDSIVKEKTQYISHAGEFDYNELKTKLEPSGQLTVIHGSRYLFPVRVYGTDSNRCFLSGKLIGESQTHVLLQLSAIETETGKYPATRVPDTSGDYLPSAIFTYISSGELHKSIRKQILGNDNLETLLDQLHHVSADTEHDSLALKIKSLATVNPGAAYSLAAILDTALYTGTAYRILLPALQDAETDEASTVLAQLAWKHKEDWSYCKSIVINGGLTTRLSDSAVGFYKMLALYRPMSKLSRLAWMALGTITDNCSRRDSVKGYDLWKWISDSLSILNGYEGGNRIKLLVWGNSNQPAAFDSVRQFLHSPLQELRTVAILCMGQFSSYRKVHFLLDIIQNDSSINNRSTAARALSGLVKDSMQQKLLGKLIAAEPDTSLQMAMLHSLDINADNQSLLVSILRSLAADNPYLSIRLEAADMLRRRKHEL